MSDEASQHLIVPARMEHLAALSLAGTYVVSQPEALASFLDWMIEEAAKKGKLRNFSEEEEKTVAEHLKAAVDWADQQVAQYFRSASLPRATIRERHIPDYGKPSLYVCLRNSSCAQMRRDDSIPPCR